MAIEAQTIQLANLPIMVNSGALMTVAFAYASYAPLRGLIPAEPRTRNHSRHNQT